MTYEATVVEVSFKYKSEVFDTDSDHLIDFLNIAESAVQEYERKVYRTVYEKYRVSVKSSLGTKMILEVSKTLIPKYKARPINEETGI